MKLHRKHLLKIGLSALLLIAMQGCSSHANYPVTWQRGNVDWEILELSAEFEHENFNLFNHKSHIIIKGKLNAPGKKNSFYEIERLFIKRYVIKEDIEKIASIQINPREGRTFDNKRYLEKTKKKEIEFSVIEITPLFTLETGKKENPVYDLIINEPIYNRSFGRNYYRIKIGDQQIDLGTLQFK
jgi:hypothetical protein